MQGVLYVVATPIGNLEDITLRAIRILQEVEIILCEDTRKTGLLFKKLKITPRGRLISYFEGNEVKRIPQILTFLKEGKNVALVSNAGTPTISDPGFKLVRSCTSSGVKVVPIPGPSAVLASLICSGLPTDKFLFLGYLPKKEGKRKKLLKDIEKIPFSFTLIIFESPKRVIKLLNEIKESWGNISIVITRELTKIYEEVLKDSVENLIKIFEKKEPKGEFTLLINIPPR